MKTEINECIGINIKNLSLHICSQRCLTKHQEKRMKKGEFFHILISLTKLNLKQIKGLKPETKTTRRKWKATVGINFSF